MQFSVIPRTPFFVEVEVLIHLQRMQLTSNYCWQDDCTYSNTTNTKSRYKNSLQNYLKFNVIHRTSSQPLPFAGEAVSIFKASLMNHRLFDIISAKLGYQCWILFDYQMSWLSFCGKFRKSVWRFYLLIIISVEVFKEFKVLFHSTSEHPIYTWLFKQQIWIWQHIF